MIERSKALEMFNQNENLARFVISKYFPNLKDDEDILQEALFGLWKACLQFDPEKGTKFSTYATISIKNAIYMCLRDVAKKHVSDISLDTTMIRDDDGDEEPLLNFIPSEPEKIIGFSRFEEIYRPYQIDILNRLLAGQTQREIAKDLGVSQTTINREVKKMAKILHDNVMEV